jgi:GxxExxY protein
MGSTAIQASNITEDHRDLLRNFLALAHRGLKVNPQFPLPVWFRGEQSGDFRADLLMAGVVVLELKACRAPALVHEAQRLNYLRACDVEIDLLNFAPVASVKRLVFANK